MSAADGVIKRAGQPDMVFKNAQPTLLGDWSGVNVMNALEFKFMLFTLDYGDRSRQQTMLIEDKNLQLDEIKEALATTLPKLQQATASSSAPPVDIVTDFLQLAVAGVLPAGAFKLNLPYQNQFGGAANQMLQLDQDVLRVPGDYQPPPSTNEFDGSLNPPGSSSLQDGKLYHRPDGTWFIFRGAYEIGVDPTWDRSKPVPPYQAISLLTTGPALEPAIPRGTQLTDPYQSNWPQYADDIANLLPQWETTADKMKDSLAEQSVTMLNFVQQLNDKYQQFANTVKGFVEAANGLLHKILANFL